MVARNADTEKFTDVGNAKRLVKSHGKDIRYVPTWGTWLIWNERRWAPDDRGKIVELAKETIRDLFAVAGRIKDDGHRDRLLQHAGRRGLLQPDRHGAGHALHRPLTGSGVGNGRRLQTAAARSSYRWQNGRRPRFGFV